MGNPRPRVDGALLDQTNDAGEVTREGVAGAHDREFAAVERRCVRKLDFLLGDADENEAGAESAIVQRMTH